MLYLKYSAASAIGKREENKDNLLVNGALPMNTASETACSLQGQADPCAEGGCLFAVFDGVGKLKGSAPAAMYAASYMNKQKYLLAEGMPPREWFAQTFDRIDGNLEEQFSRTHMSGACTVTAMYIKDGRYFFANLGDSPAFLIAGRQLAEISQRHNLKAIKERYNAAMGYQPGDADYLEVLPRDKNTLQFYLGGCPEYPSEQFFYTEGELRRNQSFILCSDGVTNAFPDRALLAMAQMQGKAAELVNHSANAPAADNCTCILIRVCEKTGIS